MSDAHQPEVDLVHLQAVVPKNWSPKEFKTLNFKAYKYNETGLTLLFKILGGNYKVNFFNLTKAFPLLVQQIDSFTLF